PLPPRDLRRRAAHLRAGGGRLPERIDPRRAGYDDDRQHHPAEVSAGLPVPDRGGPFVHTDGGSPGRHLRVCPDPRNAGDRGVRVSATVTRPLPREARVTGPAPRPPLKRRWTRFILPAYSGLVMFYLVLPILVMILYS